MWVLQATRSMTCHLGGWTCPWVAAWRRSAASAALVSPPPPVPLGELTGTPAYPASQATRSKHVLGSTKTLLMAYITLHNVPYLCKPAALVFQTS